MFLSPLFLTAYFLSWGNKMIHYVFNNNKALVSNKGHIFVIHYCENCKCELVGEWIFENITEWREKKKKEQNEVREFLQSRKCPICGKEYSNKPENHFCNYYIAYLNDNVIPAKACNIANIKDTLVRYIPSKIRIHNKELLEQHNTIPTSETNVVTKNGAGIIVECFQDNNEVTVKYYDDNIESIISYLNYFRLNSYSSEVESRVEAFFEKNSENNENIRVYTDHSVVVSDPIKYLENLLSIEKSIFTISERLRTLYYLDISVEAEVKFSERISLLKSQNEIQEALVEYQNLQAKSVENEITIEDFPITYPDTPLEPQKPNEPILAKPGLLNKKRFY